MYCEGSCGTYIKLAVKGIALYVYREVCAKHPYILRYMYTLTQTTEETFKDV